MRKRCRDQIILAAETLVERPLGEFCPLGDLIHRNPQESLAPEQVIGRVKDKVVRLSWRPRHCPTPTFREVYRGVNLHRRGAAVRSPVAYLEIADAASLADIQGHQSPARSAPAGTPGRRSYRYHPAMAAYPDRSLHRGGYRRPGLSGALYRPFDKVFDPGAQRLRHTIQRPADQSGRTVRARAQVAALRRLSGPFHDRRIGSRY